MRPYDGEERASVSQARAGRRRYETLFLVVEDADGDDGRGPTTERSVPVLARPARDAGATKPYSWWLRMRTATTDPARVKATKAAASMAMRCGEPRPMVA